MCKAGAYKKCKYIKIFIYTRLSTNYKKRFKKQFQESSNTGPLNISSYISLNFVTGFCKLDLNTHYSHKDLIECCKNLFNNWLRTDHGPKPKTYQTLLKHIKKIDKLAAASKVIEKDLIEGRKVNKILATALFTCY